jgi:IS30 family transposase
MASNHRFTDSKQYNKHFTLDDRLKIQKIITESKYKLKDIAMMLEKDPTTISKEIKRNRSFKQASYNRTSWANSLCIHFSECNINNICGKTCNAIKCKKCIICISDCQNFKERICPTLTKFPWCCNGCSKQKDCHLNKYFYYADISECKYQELLHSSREGINITEAELKQLDDLITPLVNKGQSLEHIFFTHEDEIPCKIRTVYSYIENHYISIKNVDLRRKVKYKPRKVNKPLANMKSKAKISRTYEDYINYIECNPNTDVVQMDTVEGVKGGSYLLTIHFVRSHFMIAFKLLDKRPESIITIFNHIQDKIGLDEFKRIFPVILTDNGTEFYKPDSIEFDPETGLQRTKIFYCHPMASWEKGAIENNHHYIRYYFPKGTSIDSLTQDKINIMFSHINATKRKSTDKHSPYDLARILLGDNILDAFGINYINPDDVILTPILLK